MLKKLEKDPRDTTFRVKLARLRGFLGDHAAAVEQWSILIRSAPHDAGYLNARCLERFVWNNGLNQALADCNKALKMEPNNSNTLDSRASIKLRLNRYLAAVEDYSAAIALNTNCAHCFYGRGLAHMGKRNTPEAFQDFEKAKALDPTIDRYFWNPRFPDEVE